MGLFYIHGKDSSPQGVRARFLAEHFPSIRIPALPNDLDQRLEILDREIQEPSVVVGNSLGGLTALLWLPRRPALVHFLILLAPAVGFFDPNYDAVEIRTLLDSLLLPGEIPCRMLAAIEDEIIPIAAVDRLVARSQPLGDLHYCRIHDSHLLHSPAACAWLRAAVEEGLQLGSSRSSL
jgi:pimeloyl-ACP methyl ester carboxylesterase